MTEPAGAAVEPEPAGAAEVFGSRLELARRYAALLATDGVVQGLVGPREPARIWTRHLLNGAALAPLVPPGSVVVDLGSGAGLPGIPLALARPDLAVVLLEPLARRVRFLTAVRAALGLDVEVRHAGAADAGRGQADVVVARAVAPLPRLLALALPLLRPGGTLLAVKGANAAAELDAARRTAPELTRGDVAIVPLGPDAGDTVVVRVVTGEQALPLAAVRRKGAR